MAYGYRDARARSDAVTRVYILGSSIREFCKWNLRKIKLELLDTSHRLMINKCIYLNL